MEVSSHALELDRVHGLKFNYVCFTNLTVDHLLFHKTMDNYFTERNIKTTQKIKQMQKARSERSGPFSFVMTSNVTSKAAHYR